MYRIKPKASHILLDVDKRVTMDLKTAFRIRPLVWGRPVPVLLTPWDSLVDALDFRPYEQVLELITPLGVA